MNKKIVSRKIMSKKNLVRKAVILIAIIAVNLILNAGGNNKSTEVSEAFCVVEYDEISSAVEGFGEYTGDYLTGSNAANFIQNAAKDMGIEGDLNITEEISDNTRTLSGTRNTTMADVVFKFITYEEKSSNNVLLCRQYFYVGITFKNSADYASSYRKIIEKIYDDRNIEGEVYIYFNGTCNGQIGKSIMENMVNMMVSEIGGKITMDSESQEYYCAYGYAEGIGDTIKLGDKKINFNIVIKYDEARDITTINLSSPINNTDF